MRTLRRILTSFYFVTVANFFRRFYCMGRRHRYFCHRYNATWRNERAVEIPVCVSAISDYLANHPGEKVRILELGNVLSHYLSFPDTVEHTVVDKYEVAPGVINADILDYVAEEPFDVIVGISTLEHVGYDEQVQNALKPLAALAHLKTLLKPNGLGLVTIPIGYNRSLTLFLRAGLVGFSKQFFLKRISAANDWMSVPFSAVKNAAYGKPFENASAICFGFFVSDKQPRE